MSRGRHIQALVGGVVLVVCISWVVSAPLPAAATEPVVDEVTYASYTDDGGTHDLHLRIARPSGAGERPAVVLVPGGGFIALDPGTRARHEGPFLAADFVVATVEYRTDPSLVRHLTAPPSGTLGTIDCDWEAVDGELDACPSDLLAAERAAQHDIQAAVRFLRANAVTYGIDASAVVALGESAGAIATLDVLYRSDDPGSVGSNQAESSEVAAAVAVGGYGRSRDQDSGDGPALLVAYTESELGPGGVFGFNAHDQNRRLVDESRANGVVVELRGLCGAHHVPAPNHQSSADDFAATSARAVEFLTRAAAGAAPLEEGTWYGDLTGTTRTAGQDMMGDQAPLVGDFDDVSGQDILWWDPSGNCSDLWSGGGTPTLDPEAFSVTDASGASTASLPSSGTPFVGDFDGDGSDDDLFFYSPSVSFFGDVVSGEVVFRRVPRTVWLVTPPVVGDFDGDGMSDLLWSKPGAGGETVLFGRSDRGWTQKAIPERLGSEKPVVGDFDGDGDGDVYWFGSGTAADDMWFSNGSARSFTPSTPSGASVDSDGVPQVGDFDGNGIDDLFSYGTSSSRSYFFVDPGNGTVSATTVGMTIWTLAHTVIGDFNDDGRDGIVMYGPGGYGDLYWQGTSTTNLSQVTPFVIGGSYTPVPGTFDHGDAADIIWHR